MRSENRTPFDEVRFQAEREARREALRFDPVVSEILAMDGKPKIIGDVSILFGVTFRALRHYQVKGLLQPTMTTKGRVFSHKDQVRLRLILEGKKWGLGLDVIKEILNCYDPEAGCLEQLRLVLKAIGDRRTYLEAERAKIGHQIDLLKRALVEGPQVIR